MSLSLAGHLTLGDGGLSESCDAGFRARTEESDKTGVGLTVGLVF